MCTHTHTSVTSLCRNIVSNVCFLVSSAPQLRANQMNFLHTMHEINDSTMIMIISSSSSRSSIILNNNNNNNSNNNNVCVMHHITIIIATCSSAVGPERAHAHRQYRTRRSSNETPVPPSVGFEPQTSCIWEPTLWPTELSVPLLASLQP